MGLGRSIGGSRIGPLGIRVFATIGGVALAWFGAFHFNEYIFSSTAQTSRANWIFLPAALRLIAILLFGELGAVGLIVGAFLTTTGTTGDALHEVVLACTSGMAPLLAVGLLNRAFHLPASLAGLHARHIALFSVGCALSNAVLLNGYLWLSGRLQDNLEHIASVFAGDVLGMAIVMLVLSLILSLAMPRRRA